MDEPTIKFAIHDAIAETAHLTGLRAGDAADTLVDAIYASIMRPDIRHALNADSQEGGDGAA